MRMIDLSLTVDSLTPVYPGDDGVALLQHKYLKGDNYNSFLFKTELHVGTHIDMPMHMIADNRTVDEFGLENFMGDAVLLDVEGEEVIGYKKQYSKLIKEKDIVVLRTGMSKYFYSDCQRYFTQHPQIGDDLLQFLLTRRIKMLGIDACSPDHEPFQVHKALLKNDIFILENLTNLEALENTGRFKLVALPIKLKAEASLVRAAAIIE